MFLFWLGWQKRYPTEAGDTLGQYRAVTIIKGTLMKNTQPMGTRCPLYMPARKDIAEVVLEGKIPGLRSLVVCPEDAVSEHDILLRFRIFHCF